MYILRVASERWVICYAIYVKTIVLREKYGAQEILSEVVLSEEILFYDENVYLM